jgi:Mn-dependent DtxR family transcriptional regulator
VTSQRQGLCPFLGSRQGIAEVTEGGEQLQRDRKDQIMIIENLLKDLGVELKVVKAHVNMFETCISEAVEHHGNHE